MTDDELRLLRAFAEQVDAAALAAAGLFNSAAAGTLTASDAERAAGTLRDLAGHARIIRRMLPPREPLVM